MRKPSLASGDVQDAVEPFSVPAIGQRPVWKTSEVVAFAVVRYIVDHRLESGARLPLEAEMVEHYGVSRESLREALRLLEAQGIVSIRRGPNGGPVVGRAESGNLGRTMTLYFQLAGATYEELLRAWRMLEPLAAELAARNPNRLAIAGELDVHCSHFDDGGSRHGLHGALEQLALPCHRSRRQPRARPRHRGRRRHHPHPRAPAHRSVRARAHSSTTTTPRSLRR